MQKLIQGIHKFREKELGKYQELFHRLSEQGQNPHTLFITCCDSRILAELITQSRPGDPSVNVRGSTNSTAAAIEFAVQTLGVKDVVICGHSSCGAMEGLLLGVPDKEQMPHLAEWLEVAAPVRELIENKYSYLKDREERLTAASQENVLFGLENLHTYPLVKEKLEQGTLRLHAWFFKIATAEIFAYDPILQQFQRVEKELT
jgi:carbonic anhydrase